MISPKSGITFLKTRDLDLTTNFYTTKLGLRLVLDQGSCRIFEVCPNCYIGFCHTDGNTGSDELIFTLEIDDVDGRCEQLEKNGVEIEIRPRINEKYGIYQMFIRDPNGYRIEMQRFMDQEWNKY